jgi:hypothetical protein
MATGCVNISARAAWETVFVAVALTLPPARQPARPKLDLGRAPQDRAAPTLIGWAE